MAISFDILIAALSTVTLVFYLFYALLFPEKM